MASAIFLTADVSVTASPDVRSGIAAWGAGEHAKAVSIWRPLAAAGNADAQFNLAQAYKLGRGVPLNLATAQGYYERAARQGHRDAQTSLGMTMFGNGDQIGAMRWLKLAAESGEPRAMLVYGTALFNGDGVVADRIRAYAMMSRSAVSGIRDASVTLDAMDQMMPLAERQRGIALALQMAGKLPVQEATKRVPPAAKVSARAPAKKTVAFSVGGAWRIQLGAFGQRSAAEALYRRLSSGGALAGRQPTFATVGPVTRLQVGPYPTRAAATAACASMSGQACFPVK